MIYAGAQTLSSIRIIRMQSAANNGIVWHSLYVAIATRIIDSISVL